MTWVVILSLQALAKKEHKGLEPGGSGGADSDNEFIITPRTEVKFQKINQEFEMVMRHGHGSRTLVGQSQVPNAMPVTVPVNSLSYQPAAVLSPGGVVQAAPIQLINQSTVLQSSDGAVLLPAIATQHHHQQQLMQGQQFVTIPVSSTSAEKQPKTTSEPHEQHIVINQAPTTTTTAPAPTTPSGRSGLRIVIPSSAPSHHLTNREKK